MDKNITKSLFLFLLIVYSISLFSQKYCFRNYSINDGLPQSNVFCMIQDSRGYLWMGTEGGGLCQFDGVKFTTYTKRDGLSGNIVRSLLSDNNGNIWIGTENGITIYTGYDFIVVGEEQGFSGTTVLDVFQDSKNNIWAATNDAGIFKINYTRDSIKIDNYSVSQGLTNYFVWDIEEDRFGRLWIAMPGGINILEFGEKLKVRSLDKGFEIPSDHILDIEISDDQIVYAGTYNEGIFSLSNIENLEDITLDNSLNAKFDTHTENIWDIHYNNKNIWIATGENGIIHDNGIIVTNYNNSNGLSHNMILDIFQDNEGNIWISTMGSGIDMFIGETFVHYRDDKNFPFKQVFAIKNVGSNLYLGTDQGFKIYEMRDKELILKKEFLKDEKVNSIDIDFEKNIWAGTTNGVFLLKGNETDHFTLEDGLYNNHINSLYIDNEGVKWFGTNRGYNKLFDNEIVGMNEEDGFINNEIQTIIQDKKGRIWMGTLGGLVKLDGKSYADFNEEDGLLDLKIHTLAEDTNGNIWIGTFGSGIFKFDIKSDSIPISFVIDNHKLTSNNIYSLLFIDDSTLIAGTDKGFDLISFDENFEAYKVVKYGSYEGFYGVENNLNSIEKDESGKLWFGTIDGLSKFDIKNTRQFIGPKIYIENIKLFFDEVNWNSRTEELSRWTKLPEQVLLHYRDNHLTFDFTAIYNSSPKNLQFTYMLEGQTNTWSPLTSDRSIVFSGLNPGDYDLKIRPITNSGEKGEIFDYNFRIEPPFWQKLWFIILCIVLIGISFVSLIRYRTRKLRLETIKLEKIVLKRTKEVREQKDEIQKQSDEIQQQNVIVTAQKKEITDSIQYAQRIQEAVLPQREILAESFKDSFILFKPKDIVSGDFYWMAKKDNKVIVAAADCTGHGVPGAFMSMLGVSFLNKIVNEWGITESDQIINKLRESIIQALRQKGFSGESKDGMDLALCVYDLDEKKLQFTGANNPLLLIRKVNKEYELQEFKGDRMPVAIHMVMDDFKRIDVEIQPNDTIYMFSDGFVDQFGGPDGRKYMKKNFKKLLLENQNKSMPEQLKHYESVLKDWINFSDGKCKKHEQIDDILVIGIKI
jgi:ligand-binding sensor domain-containing protein/serine phosphatase RsbU (regulator of sigma subunit)